IMPPLLKLRQDCTVPTIRQRHKNAGNIAVKKALTPNELMAYMVKNNETDCKEKLRIIGTSLNGQAAIYIIRSEFDVAVKIVDSLLQVHALHNLIEITEPTNDANDQREEYKKDLERLEWKYLDNSVNLVRDAKDQLRKVQNEIIDRVNEADDNSFRWWAEYAVNASKNVKLEQQIMDRISAEMQNYSNPAIENMSTIHGVAYVVGIWLDRFDQERNQVQESFKQLEFFSNNIKPRSGLDPENLQKVDALVKAAFDCHLDNDEEHGKKRNSKKKEKRSLCLLCQVKKVLLKYECLIFDKTFVEDVEKENSGNWNRSFQEGMLRVLYSFAKRNLSDEIALKDGALHLQIIELMKEEYKQYSQFWVEVNHSAAAYDELKMCKSRIRVNDLEIEDEPTKSTLHISKYEVDEKLDEFRMEKELAERKFIRIQGILKYLKHLENNVEPDNCPICKEKPTKK
ncbi:E3 ubiquitin-protein ligase SHPRH, partial [Pseudolycoriella hygida]